jgi:5'-nucleotidase
MPKILVTNDDGINAEGLKALIEILRPLGGLYVCAPHQERSAASHSISFHHPLRVQFIDKRTFAIEGTPSDCVMFGVHWLRERGIRPDIIVSGINRGANLGDDVTYSGTVCAAMEGAILGIPSLAVSSVSNSKHNYFAGRKYIRIISENIIANGLSNNTFLNMNIPGDPKKKIKGIMLVKQGKRIYRDKMIKKKDPRGNVYYWLGGEKPIYKNEKNTDFYAISRNMISVTPLHFDLTNHALMANGSFIEALSNKLGLIAE